MGSDMATTPTGCSVSQIDESTHYHKHNIPAGKKQFNRASTDISNKVSKSLRAICLATCKVVARFMDEHSMSDWQIWAWL